MTNEERDTNHAILTDNCNSQHGTEWLAPKGATDSDAEIIIDIGCVRKMLAISMKNLKRKLGGTKTFTLFLSDSVEGPWKSFFTDKLPQSKSDSCGPLHNIEFRYIRILLARNY